MGAFATALLSRVVPADRSFAVYPYQGKQDLLGKLEARLRGYEHWLPADWRILVLVDRDGDDCEELKARLEGLAARARLRTRSKAGSVSWQVVNRLAIEELEAWYFGSWEAVCRAFPGVSPKAASKAAFRDPDAIRGGTWEAFERILKRHGFFQTGLRKIEAARTVGSILDPGTNRSRSFARFFEAVVESIGGQPA